MKMKYNAKPNRIKDTWLQKWIGHITDFVKRKNIHYIGQYE